MWRRAVTPWSSKAAIGLCARLGTTHGTRSAELISVSTISDTRVLLGRLLLVPPWLSSCTERVMPARKPHFGTQHATEDRDRALADALAALEPKGAVLQIKPRDKRAIKGG
jgi:hypothetical protein